MRTRQSIGSSRSSRSNADTSGAWRSARSRSRSSSRSSSRSVFTDEHDDADAARPSAAPLHDVHTTTASTAVAATASASDITATMTTAAQPPPSQRLRLRRRRRREHSSRRRRRRRSSPSQLPSPPPSPQQQQRQRRRGSVLWTLPSSPVSPRLPLLLSQRRWWPQWHRPRHATLDLFARLHGNDDNNNNTAHSDDNDKDSSNHNDGAQRPLLAERRRDRARRGVVGCTLDWYYELLRSRRARLRDTVLECEVARVRRATAPTTPQQACLRVMHTRTTSLATSPSAQRQQQQQQQQQAEDDGEHEGDVYAHLLQQQQHADARGERRSEQRHDRFYSSSSSSLDGDDRRHRAPGDVGTTHHCDVGILAAAAAEAAAAAAAAKSDAETTMTRHTTWAARVRRFVHNASYARLLKMAMLMLLVLTGNTMQVLMLNFWLHSFPADQAPGNYTTFAVSSMTYAVFFVVTLVVYVVLRRPSVRFAWSRHGALLILVVGLADTASSVLTVYAATHVSEVLQALSMSTAPLVTAFLQKRVLRDPRNYRHRLVIVSFACTIAGVLVAMSHPLLSSLAPAWRARVGVDSSSNSNSNNSNHNKKTHASSSSSSSMIDQLLWSLVYFAAVLPVVVQNVVQTDYMVTYTRDALFEQWLLERRTGVDVAQAAAAAAAVAHAPVLSVAALAQHTRAAHCDNNNNDNNEEQQEVKAVGDAHVRTRCCASSSSSSWRSTLADSAGMHNEWHEALTPSQQQQQQQHKLQQQKEEEGDELRRLPAVAVYGTFDAHAREHAVVKPPPPPPLPPPLVIDDDTVSESMFSLASGHTHIRVRYDVAQGGDLIVKLVLLAGDTTLQAMMVLLLLPMDALPWFGRSTSVAQTWRGLVDNLYYLRYRAHTALLFPAIYCAGYIATYVGVAYLDQYSLTLCSMTTQLASPLTALVLVVFPRLNLSGDHTPWYSSALAIVLLATGALLYVVWDARTVLQKMLGEFALKEAFVRPRVVLQQDTTQVSCAAWCHARNHTSSSSSSSSSDDDDMDERSTRSSRHSEDAHGNAYSGVAVVAEQQQQQQQQQQTTTAAATVHATATLAHRNGHSKQTYT